MALLLGVDTGGTYTDAVLLDESAGDGGRVIAHAKSLTTRRDLALGIGRAVGSVLAESGVAPDRIALAALSTTLATNALVEGQGGRVGLVSVGFDPADLTRHGLPEALRADPLIAIAGGHAADGTPRAALGRAALTEGLARHAGDVGAFAVASLFSVRNPEHEITVRDMIRDEYGLPVTCSHELTSNLNGPRRAVTAVLNARLIALIDHLIEATEGLLASIGVDAPLMVVRGDGALISAAFARTRPIETILSGPAASVVGARWLTGADHAIVSDIGGTTTDVAVLRGGRPKLDPEGARVGGWKTMVEAVAMHTVGLGGDSEVHLLPEGLAVRLRLGPRRCMPLAMFAAEHPEVAHEALDAQLRAPAVSDTAGRFALPMLRAGAVPAGLDERETRLLDQLSAGPLPLDRLLRTRLAGATLDRLVGRGLAMVAALTPTDASHVLGLHDGFDREAATKGAALFARRRSGRGERIAADGAVLARMVIDQLTEQTAETILAAAFEEDGFPQALAGHPLTRAGLDGHAGLIRTSLAVAVPLIGLGASAPTYYGAVGRRLGAETVLPEHAGVANAIGAVVGNVRVEARATLTQPDPGAFRAHLASGTEDFADLERAYVRVEELLDREARDLAAEAGADDPRVTLSRDVVTSLVEGQEMFIEARVKATAQGRPRMATGAAAGG